MFNQENVVSNTFYGGEKSPSRKLGFTYIVVLRVLSLWLKCTDLASYNSCRMVVGGYDVDVAESK